jgi:hypothetical protein
MENINNYQSNKATNAFKATQDIKNFITKYVKNKHISEIIKDLSNLTKIPTPILEHDAKQAIIQYYSFSLRKFSKRFRIKHFLYDSIKFISFTLFLFFCKKKILSKAKYKYMVDDIEQKSQLQRFSKLAKLNKNSIFIIKKKFKLDQKDEEKFKIKLFFFYRKYYAKFIEDNKLNILKLFFKIFKYSLYCKTNLFLIYLILFYKIINYETIFSQVSAKYLIIDRFYKTSAIKDFLFKKHGGKLTACTQKNLLEFTISFYIYTDILFTLGKSKPKYLNSLGCKIKKYIPTGSLFLESSNEKQKVSKKIPKIDILFIGINFAHALDRMIVDKFQYDNYYKTIQWLEILSTKFPKMNIVIKHHDNYSGDAKEIEMLKSSKIKIIYKGKYNLSSYEYIRNSNLILSFGSTMILEGLTLGKKCYFIDPNYQNATFFKTLDASKKLRLANLSNLIKIVNKDSTLVRNKKINIDHFCLNSKDVSKKIVNFLN